MKIAALILGILAGLAGLIAAAFASAMVSVAGWLGADPGAVAFIRVLIFAVPIASFVGAGLALHRTPIALSIFAITSLIWLLIGFQMGAAINFMNATPLLFSVAATLLCVFAENPIDGMTGAAHPPYRTPVRSHAPADPAKPASLTTSRRIPDADKWNALVRFDEDVRQTAEKLAPFGQHWVDELAASYMAIGDKSYLSKIETRLLAEAEEEKVRLEAEAEAARQREAEEAEEARLKAERLFREAEIIQAEKLVRSEQRRKAMQARVDATRSLAASATSKTRTATASLFEKLRERPLTIALAALVVLSIAGHFAYTRGYFNQFVRVAEAPPAQQTPAPAPAPTPVPQKQPQASERQNPPPPQAQPERRQQSAIDPNRGWLGVDVEEFDSFPRRPDRIGARVAKVHDNSPARFAGIRVGDVITHINGQEIRTLQDLPRVVGALRPGTTAIVILYREGRQMALAAVLAARPDSTPQQQSQQTPPPAPQAQAQQQAQQPQPRKRSRRFSGDNALEADTGFLSNLNEHDINDIASDLPRKYPAEFRALRAVMPAKFRGHDWAYNLNGTAIPMKKFTYDGRTHYYGLVCKPRDCTENWLRFIVEEGGGRAVGFISSPQLVGRYGTQIMSDFFGEITEDEYHLFVGSLMWE